MKRLLLVLTLLGAVLPVPSHAAPCKRYCKAAINRCYNVSALTRRQCKRTLVGACKAQGVAVCDQAFLTPPTTLPVLPPATTTTTLPAPQCFTDADCQDGNACNGWELCITGTCYAGTPPVCADGTSSLWLGTAGNAAGYVNIGVTVCRSGSFVSGAYACVPATLACVGDASPLTGAIYADVTGTAIIFDPLIFSNGYGCGFRGLLVGLTMGGNYLCVDPRGFTVSTGTWTLNRCP